MTRRFGMVVGLGLDDDARTLVVGDHAADQRAGHVKYRAVVEARPEGAAADPPACGTTRDAHEESPSAARASSSCSRTRAKLVPPSERLDSSHPRSRSKA